MFVSLFLSNTFPKPRKNKRKFTRRKKIHLITNRCKKNWSAKNISLFYDENYKTLWKISINLYVFLSLPFLMRQKKILCNKTLYAIWFSSFRKINQIWSKLSLVKCERVRVRVSLYVNLSKVIHRMKPFAVWPSIMYYCLVPAAAYATTAAAAACACEEIFHSIPDAYGEYVCADMCVCVVYVMPMHTQREIVSTLQYNIQATLLFRSRYAQSVWFTPLQNRCTHCACVRAFIQLCTELKSVRTIGSNNKNTN